MGLSGSRDMSHGPEPREAEVYEGTTMGQCLEVGWVPHGSRHAPRGPSVLGDPHSENAYPFLRGSYRLSEVKYRRVQTSEA